MKLNDLKRLTIQFLFSILIFTTPSNLFKKFFEETAYVNGLQIDYLIPKIHISDVILLILLFVLTSYWISDTFFNKNWLLGFVNKIRNPLQTLKKETLSSKTITIISLTLIFLFEQFTKEYNYVAILFMIRVIVLIVITVLLHQQLKISKILNSKFTSWTLQFTLIFQSLVAWYQFIFQKSVFGYSFLGETNLQAYSGLAKTTINGAELILPYGTTAHPNILGGLLTFLVLILLHQKTKNAKKNPYKVILLFIGILTILLTQSVSAMIALLIGSVLILKKPKLSSIKIASVYAFFIIVSILGLSLVTNIFTVKNNSIIRRDYLNQASISMIKKEPFLGIGARNFTAYVEKNSNHQEVVRFVQPVHNVFLLFVAEFGALGAGILLIYIDYFKKYFIQKKDLTQIKTKPGNQFLSIYLLALLPMLTWDHYLLTIQTGILIFWMSILWSLNSEQ